MKEATTGDAENPILRLIATREGNLGIEGTSAFRSNMFGFLGSGGQKQACRHLPAIRYRSLNRAVDWMWWWCHW